MIVLGTRGAVVGVSIGAVPPSPAVHPDAKSKLARAQGEPARVKERRLGMEVGMRGLPRKGVQMTPLPHCSPDPGP